MDDYNPKQLYTWYQHEDTEEWHLFKTKKIVQINTSTRLPKVTCSIENNQSACNAIDIKDTTFVLKEKCVREDAARMQAAEILKRTACGNCVSTLYASID